MLVRLNEYKYRKSGRLVVEGDDMGCSKEGGKTRETHRLGKVKRLAENREHRRSEEGGLTKVAS